MSAENLTYGNKLIYMEGIVVNIQDGAVELDLKGRLGTFKVPRRMIISDYELKLGQTAGFNMSYPEIVSEKPDQHYISNMKKLQKNKEEN